MLLLLLSLLAGCSHQGWQHTSIRNGNDAYDMAKLSYRPTDETTGIELELTRCGKEIHGYIHVQNFELPKHENDPHATTLTIQTNCATQTFVLPLYEGGQRARLTDHCLEYLLQTLELKPSVTLFSGHFSQTLDASNFRNHYDALLRKPRAIQPNSLISFELF